jgi:hypothetical protein
MIGRHDSFRPVDMATRRRLIDTIFSWVSSTEEGVRSARRKGLGQPHAVSVTPRDWQCQYAPDLVSMARSLTLLDMAPE